MFIHVLFKLLVISWQLPLEDKCRSDSPKIRMFITNIKEKLGHSRNKNFVNYINLI